MRAAEGALPARLSGGPVFEKASAEIVKRVRDWTSNEVRWLSLHAFIYHSCICKGGQI